MKNNKIKKFTNQEKCNDDFDPGDIRKQSICSFAFNLNPLPLNYTVQSKKFAIEAKSYLKSRLNLKSIKTSKKNESNMKFPLKGCFSFLHIHIFHHKNTKKSIEKHLDSKKCEELTFELIGQSLILKDEEILLIGQELPPRAVGFPWTLQFSSAKDGFSLHNLYRKLTKIDSPVLIVIEDLKGRVFGGLSSSTIRVSESFFGTSECFLYSFSPDFKVYRWNGDNFYFVQAHEDYLAFGSGMGKSGLWIDCDLNKGKSENCLTYGSPPLVPDSDFIIRNLECWTFV